MPDQPGRVATARHTPSCWSWYDLHADECDCGYLDHLQRHMDEQAEQRAAADPADLEGDL